MKNRLVTFIGMAMLFPFHVSALDVELNVLEYIEIEPDSAWEILMDADYYVTAVFDIEFWTALRTEFGDEAILEQFERSIENKTIVYKDPYIQQEDIDNFLFEDSYAQYTGVGVDNPYGNNTNSWIFTPVVKYARNSNKAVVAFDKIFYPDYCEWVDHDPQQDLIWANAVKNGEAVSIAVPGTFFSISLDLDSGLIEYSDRSYSAQRIAKHLINYYTQQSPNIIWEESRYYVHRVLSNGQKQGVKLKWIKNNQVFDNQYYYMNPDVSDRLAVYPFDGTVPYTWSGHYPVTGEFPGRGGTRKYVIDDLSDLPSNVHILGYEVRGRMNNCGANVREDVWAYIPFDEDENGEPDFLSEKVSFLLDQTDVPIAFLIPIINFILFD